MIKLFRKVRQSLLSEGKTGTYIKYAIGEIILVVIGILIALQINNWNEARKDATKAKSFLLNIKEDLKSDTVFLSEAIEQLKSVAPKTEKLLNITDFSGYKFDSLVNLLPMVYYEYTINSQTFDKLINSGITDLGRDTDLFDNINNYYTLVSNYFYSVRNWDIQETNKDNDYFLNNSFELPDNVYYFRSEDKKFHSVQSEFDRLSAFSVMLFSVVARNRLKNSYFRKKRLERMFEETRVAAVELLIKIDNATQ